MIINTEEDLARAQEYLKNSNIEEILKKTDPQDIPAVCEYSGLRPVEGYKEEEIDKKEETPEEKAYRMGWLNGYEEGANDKEISTKIGDRDFMYKWIREKSGK